MCGHQAKAAALATTLGVFFSVLLGCGLFAAAFFSDKSGHDRNVTDASKSERERHYVGFRPIADFHLVPGPAMPSGGSARYN